LRFGGAKEEVVQAAKELKCSTCERVRAPKDPPKVSVCRADQFNQAVGIDLFFIQTPEVKLLLKQWATHISWTVELSCAVKV